MKKTVSLSKWLQIKANLLNDYQHLKYISKKTEDWYLKEFEYVVGQSQSMFGKRIVCTIFGDHDDIAAFRKLPKKLRLYRGYNEKEKREGISWSLSRKVAEGFAYVSFMDGEKDIPPSVVSGTCSCKDILAYTNSRDEQEIIINPAKVHDITDIDVRTKPDFPVGAEPLDELLASMAAEFGRKKAVIGASVVAKSDRLAEPRSKGATEMDQTIGMPIASDPATVWHYTTRKEAETFLASGVLQAAYEKDPGCRPVWFTSNPKWDSREAIVGTIIGSRARRAAKKNKEVPHEPEN